MPTEKRVRDVKVRGVVLAPGRTAHFNIDLPALRSGVPQDGFVYLGAPKLPGFKTIVQPGRGLSIMLVLDDGQVAFGDCMDVIFTGAAGRDPIFSPDEHISLLRGPVSELLIGRDVSDFRSNADEIDGLRVGGKKLHTAVRYGLSQALLHATALSDRSTMAEIVSREYGTTIATAPIPILASCERDDLLQLDRMILKRADLLPHSYFTDVDAHIGRDGEKLIAYAERIRQRIMQIGDPDYRPRIHLDVYGTVGEAFGGAPERIADYLGRLADVTDPFALIVESPVVAGTKKEQIDIFLQIRTYLVQKGIETKIIADEWCNTLEDIREFADARSADYLQVKTPDLGGINNTIAALLYCREAGVGACLGGSGNETDQSTRVSVHIGLACQPDMMLSKPGLGGDEALMIQTNEMSRTLSLLAHKRGGTEQAAGVTTRPQQSAARR